MKTHKALYPMSVYFVKRVWFYFRLVYFSLTYDFHLKVLVWDSNTSVSLWFQSALPTSASGSEREKTPSWHVIFSSWLFPFGTSLICCCLLVPELSFGSQKGKMSWLFPQINLYSGSSLFKNYLTLNSLNTLGHWRHWAFLKFFFFAFSFSLFFFSSG